MPGPTSSDRVQRGHWRITNTAGATEEQIDSAVKALEVARDISRNAEPEQSGFHVGAAALLTNGEIAKGLNYEYGGPGYQEPDGRANHGEELMVGDGVIHHELGKNLPDGRKNRLEIVATTAVEAEQPAYSCGNCLDAQRMHTHPDTLMAAGSEVGAVEILRFSTQYPSSFGTKPLSEVKASTSELIELAQVAASRSFSLISKQAGIGDSGAAIRTESGAVYLGVKIDSVAYHPTEPVMAAFAAAFAASDPFIESIAYVSPTGIPDGKQRQYIYEFAQGLNKVDSLPIYLYSSDKNTVAKVTPEVLSPFGFGCDDLGLTEEMQNWLQALKDKETRGER